MSAPRKQLWNFRIDTDTLAALERIRDEIGVTVSEQVRRALELWVESYEKKGGLPRKRVAKARPGATARKREP